MEKQKKKDTKQRYLSPSFKKGAIKENKEKDEFKINLIVNGVQDDDDETMSPQPKRRSKNQSKRLSLNEESPNKSNKKSADDDIQSSSKHSKDMNLSDSQNHIKNISYISQAGKGEDGFTKVNQDSYLVDLNEFKLGDFNVFGVLDGHGLNGHLVSQFVSKYIKSHLHKNKHVKHLPDEESVYNQLKNNNYEIIRKLYTHAEREVGKSDIDANFSGTTCVIVFQSGTKLITANVGDSRAIIVKGDEVFPLSIDQKPNNEHELKRILKHGGEVSQYEEDGIKSGPFRVWKKGEMYPGIAMSRSIGDLLASTLGVIPEPEFIEMEIDKDTKFAVLASDGVWEFLDNKKVKDLVMPFYKKNDPEGACKMLINESTKWWNEEDIVVDDITVICLFF